MASLVKKAVAGHRDAMNALFNANKQTLYYMAQCLLSDDDQACAAASAAFRDALAGMKAAKVSTPDQFTALAVAMLIGHCKKKTLVKNPKALRIPHGKDFALPATHPVKKGLEDELEFVVASLPPLHRYIFVLHTMTTLNSTQIGSLLQIDSSLVSEAIAMEEENIAMLQTLSAQGFDSSYGQLQDAMGQRAQGLLVPAEMIRSCQGAIDAHAEALAPALKKKQTITLASVIAAVVVLALVITLGCISFAGSDDAKNDGSYTSTNTTSTSTSTNQETENTIPENSAPALSKDLVYYADIELADYGKITVKLDQESAPATAANFVNLAQNGFYNGLTFHRIMEGFMMQGGCPNGTGGGSADENVVGEFAANGYSNSLSHTRGAISMARSSDYNSASSQFFIVHADSVFLDGNYACFGYVTEGLDVVDAVCATAQPTDNNGTIPAAQQPVITSITIRTEEK